MGTASPELDLDGAVQPDAGPSEPEFSSDLDAGAYMVTLITGDTVAYSVGPDGRVAVDVVGESEFRGEGGPDGTYVVPASAEPYVQAGLLDKELFNVEYLAQNGYDDAQMQTMPVIVEYADQAGRASIARQADGIVPSTQTAALESINAAAVSIDKTDASDFWATLAPEQASDEVALRSADPQRTALPEGIERIWLDRVAQVDLDESVPQIGAPRAWGAGLDGTGVTVAVLDTGIDAEHPDLAGKVTAAENFTTDDSVTDGHGHGTHVASTIAGSGAASEGRFTGVAPGAKLLVGKVCDDGGSCLGSAVIAGMEWATLDQGADVVNMSLGGDPSDGTDPLSQAVDQLTEETGTLFVIAAGNRGPSPSTVAWPGAAAQALTVGAVNKEDQLASFSSRGPLTGSYHLKPEITAPGVDITAAIPGGRYGTASGTSMAAPHVAGAAALLAQRHPDWTAGQLKATLTTTAMDGDYPAWQQGAGRVDAARAVSQDLLVDVASISPGALAEPYNEHIVTRQLTYTNNSEADVAVSVGVDVRADDGQPAAGAMVTVDRDRLTVPAGGNATVEVTIDPRHGAAGLYNGHITATTGLGDSLRVPVGFFKFPETSVLTVKFIPPTNAHDWGRPCPPQCIDSDLVLMSALRVDDQVLPWRVGPEAWNWREGTDPYVLEGTASLPDGVYKIGGKTQFQNVSTNTLQYAWVTEPEVTVSGDTELVFDLRKLAPITVEPDRPSEVVSTTAAQTRTTASGVTWSDWSSVGGGLGVGTHDAPWAAYPSESEPSIGSFKLKHHHRLAEPQAIVHLRGGGNLTVQPRYLTTTDRGVSKFASDQRLRLATRADLEAGRDVSGALVYANVGGGTSLALIELEAAAHEAGAAGLLVTNSRLPRCCSDGHPIPFLWLDRLQAQQVEEFLERVPSPQAHIDAQLETPYEYNLWFHELDQVPSDLSYSVASTDLAEIDTSYHAERAKWANNAPRMCKGNHTFRPEDPLSIMSVWPWSGPTERVEYYNITGSEVVWNRRFVIQDPNGSTCIGDRSGGSVDTFESKRSGREAWNTSPGTPGQQRLASSFPHQGKFWSACAACRQGDTLWFTPSLTDGDGSHEYGIVLTDTQLYLGDTPVPVGATGFDFALPSAPDRYRLESTYRDVFDGTDYAKTVHSTWHFTSAAPSANEVELPYVCFGSVVLDDPSPCAYQPLIFLNYDIPLSLENTTIAGRPLTFTVYAAGTRPDSGRDTEGLKLWVSYDDSQSWEEARVRSRGDGEFEVTVRHPPAHRLPSDAVSIRAEAWDADGNTVEQTIERAYGLADRSARGGAKPH